MANSYETGIFPAPYSSRQRAISLTLGAAWSIPLTSTMAMANTPIPFVAHTAASGSHNYVAPTVHTSAHSLIHGTPVAVHTAAVSSAGNVNFNLASSSLNFLANNLGNFSSLAIDVGGHQEQVGLTTKLTAAEVVAAEQVLSGGTQTIKIGANGVATGGTVNLNTNLLTALDNSVGGSLSSLTIAHGVQVVDSLSSLSLSGSLNNRGSLVTASGSTGNTDVISAGSISNAAGGSIASYSGGGGLYAADPSLNASTAITNNGSISSAGNLTLSAPSVVNVSTHGVGGTINAAQNVNINTQSLTNSGTIAAAAGNVNVTSSGALSIAGSGGTIQANNGNINVAAANSDINVEGGNMLSQQVNFTAGTGNITAQMDDVSGVVNATGNDVHVGANTANLNLGNIDATGGDPIFTSTGNLNIDGTVVGTAGNPLTLIAGGNIVSAAGNAGLVTSGGVGGELNLIAGAVFTGTGPATVTKGSATGGEIDLTGGGANPIASINTSGTAGAGGAVQMVAFAGTGAGSGTINVPTNVTINAGGTTTAGNVTLIAGAKTGTAISTGAIIGSVVALDVSTPVVSSKGVLFDATGLQTSGTFTATATGNVANASVGNVTGTLNAISAGTVTVANTTALTLGTVSLGKTGALVASDSGGNITVDGVITGASATLTTSGAHTITMGAGTPTPSINTTVLNVNSGTGTDVLTTDGTSLVLNTTGSVTDTQGLNTLAVSGTVAGAGSTLQVTAGGQINVSSPLFVTNNTLDLTAGGKGGINIGANILMGTGTVNLTTTGTGKLSESKGITLAAQKIVLNSAESFGAKTTPFLTDASNSLTVDVTGTKNSAYVSDQNFQTLTFQGNPATTGGSIFLTSAANTLNVGTANYNTVSITDNVATTTGGINFAAVAMGGTGTFTAISGGAIKTNGVDIIGSTVTLTGIQGVGTKVNPIGLTSANIVLTSTAGNVYATDNLATTVNGSAALLGTFSVNDSGAAASKTGDSLTVGKSVGGNNIILSTSTPTSGTAGSVAVTGTVGSSNTATVAINSAAGVTTKGAINGAGITFNASGPVSVGGTVGNSVSTVTLMSTSASGITLSGALSGNGITVDATNGPVTITKAITGTGPDSKITIEGNSATATGNAVVVGAAITGSTIDVGIVPGGQGNIALNAAVGNTASASTTISSSNGLGTGGSIIGAGVVSGTTVTLTADNSIGTSAKPITTAAGTLSANAAGSATGDGAFITQKGNLALGTSNDDNLVVKVTGNLDVASGAVVTAPNLNLTSTGTTTVDGTIQNTSGTAATTGTMVITSGGNFTVNQSGLIQTTAGSNPIAINVTGSTTVNGTVSVAALTLKSSNGFSLAPGAQMTDGMDTLTVTGPFDVNGQLGRSDGSTVFKIVDTGSVVIGQLAPQATIIGSGTVQGSSIVNYVTLNGASGITYTGTGTGEAFQNYGSIVGLGITVSTTNPLGVIYNAPGATIVATETALSGGNPTVNLNTYGVDNQGTIGAVGLLAADQGILNITSPGALTISGVANSFLVGAFNAVNLTAKGNVTVGGVVNGVTVNPFNNFTAANELGNFSVNTTGIFSTTMPGVSVMTNTTGSFGGTISIQASNVTYNGLGTAPVFALSAIGAGPLVSSGTPIKLELSGSQGITIDGTSGHFSVNAEGYAPTAVSTFSTPGPLLINTTAFDVNQTSLNLTGTARVLITGNLDEGTNIGTQLTIMTAATTPFLVGGATTNGVTGITGGQGISTGTLQITSPGGVVIGTGGASPVGAVLTGSEAVELFTQNLTINKGSDVVGLGLTVQVNSGNTTYTNLNTNGGISASALTINDYAGTITMVSGGTNATTNQAQFSIGFNPNGPSNGSPVIAGGTFNLNAQALSFSSKGLAFYASGGVDGGQVNINLSGPTDGSVANTIAIGLGAGQISANVAGTVNDYEPAGVGTFRLTNAGNITGVNIFNASNPSLSAINFGPNDILGFGAGGVLSLIADGPGATGGTGTTVLVSGVSGLFLNLLQISSNSTTPLLATGASSNGIKDANATFGGGGFVFTNLGNVVTNGVTLTGTALTLTSAIGNVDTSGNPTFTVQRAFTPTGTVGGQVTINAQAITTSSNGLGLTVQGGSLSGANIQISTTVTPVTIGSTSGTNSNISFDVGDMVIGSTGNYVAANVSVFSPGALLVNGAGIKFVDGAGTPGVGGSLNLQSASGGTTGNGFPLTFTNAAAAVGLNFSAVNLGSGSTATFDLGGASASGNGIVGSSVLTAGSVSVVSPTIISTANEVVVAHSITLTAPTVTFNGTPITVLPDGLTVGITGPLTTPTGDGGIITVNASAITFTGGGTQFTAMGDGKTASSTGGTINFNDTGSTNLAIVSTNEQFNVSNAFDSATGGQVAGTVNITNIGNVTLNAAGVFTYGATGGTLSVTAPNIQVSNIASLSAAAQESGTQPPYGLGLNQVTFTSTSSNAFSMSSTPTINGILDAAGTTFVSTGLTIVNKGTGGVDMTGAQAIQPNSLTITAAGAPVTFTAGEVITATQAIATGSTGQGGSINISAGSLVIPAGGLVTFHATGDTASGTGGSVQITDTSTSALNIGTTGLAFIVTNTGTGEAGSVSVTNGGALTVSGAGLTFGPTVTATGSGGLTLSGSSIALSDIAALSAHPLATISLSSTSTSTFVFGGAAANGNGFVDTGAVLKAASISITNTGGIDTTGTTTLSTNSMSLSTPGAINLISGTGLSVTSDPTSNNGGTISLTAGSITYTGAAAAPLNAAAAAGGTGGTISVTVAGTNPLVIGAGGLTFNVAGNGAGELAGNVKVANAGNLIVDGSAFTFGPAGTGNQGSGTLSLTGTNMLLSNVTALSAIPLSSIVLVTNSASDFVFGGATVNGFVGNAAQNLTAASITINNNTSGPLAGGISTTGVNANANTTLVATNITLATENVITFGAGTTITAVPALPTNVGGSITITTGEVAYAGSGGSGVTLSAVGAATGAGGKILVSVAGTQAITVGTTGLQFNVTSTGGTGGTVSVVNGGAITADCASIKLGPTFATNMGPSVTLNANGALSVSNIASIEPVNMGTIVLSSDSIQSFVLGGATGGNGITDANPNIFAGNLTIANQGGAISRGTATSLNGSIGMTLSASTDIGSSAVGGAIILGGSTVNADTIINAGGSAYISVTDSAKTSILNFYEVGALSIASTGTGDLAVGTNTGGNFNASSVSVTYTGAAGNGNTVSLGNISATDGNLTVSSNAENLVVITKAVDSAYNGNVSLQNDSTNANANINFNAGQVVLGVIEPTTVHASGSLVSTDQGNVSIFLGPANFTPVAGVTPANGYIMNVAPGQVTFSSAGNPNGSINVADDSDELFALARNLEFTTNGASSNAITLGSYVYAIADPPGIAPVVVPTYTNTPITAGMQGVAAGSASAYIPAPVSITPNTTTIASPVAINAMSVSPATFSTNTAAYPQAATNTANLLNGVVTSSSSYGINAINNASVANMTVQTAGGGLATLDGVAAGAVVQTSSSDDSSGNAGAAVTGKTSLDNTPNIGTPRTLTGGVSNTITRAMDRGPLLLSPLQNELLETPFGTVSVAANSVVLVIASDNGLAVYNLHDTHKNAVVIKSGRRTIAVNPGRSAVLTRSSVKSFEELNPARFVAYRGLSNQDVAEGGKVFQADFDVTTLMHGLPAVKKLLLSESAQARKTMRSMLKTAAILSQVSQSSEQFALYLPPEVTAYASANH